MVSFKSFIAAEDKVYKHKDGAWYAFYECSSSVKRGNLCTPHYTRQDKLEADVLAAIQLQVKAALNYDKLLAKLRNSEGERSIRDQQNALITSLNLKLSGISKKRTRLYEDFTEGILDEEEYAFAKKAYDEQYADLSRRLDEAVQRKVKFAEAMSEDNKWLTLMKSVSGATMLSQELVDASVAVSYTHLAPSRPFKEKTEVSLYPASASSQAAAPHDCYSSPEVAHSLSGGLGVGSCVASQKRKDPQH